MILHVDMDAFYASVEQRDRPELASKPVIVGGTPEQRGVVAAASYAVRKFGVHSAMPTATALRLCPQAVVLPVRIAHYAAISRQIRKLFFRYTPLVEPLSLDEAFLDVSGCRGLFGSGEQIAQQLKREIHEQTGLVASIGVAPNKFLAKIASDLEKPDALVVVSPQDVDGFLAPLPVSRLWGVGKVTDQRLERLGVRTIGQLRTLSREALKAYFGDSGEHFWKLAHGIDERPVVSDREARSLSHETTFAADLFEPDALRGWLLQLTDQVGRRLRRQAKLARTVQIKLRFTDFRTITRSRTLAQPTDVTAELWQAASELLRQAVPPSRRLVDSGVRLLGMGVSGIADPQPVQQRLFDEPDTPQHAKQRQLDRVTDAVRERFGAAALARGSVAGLAAKRPDSPESLSGP